MHIEPITISASIDASLKKTWLYYIEPDHITKWNFADPSWHCPSATNDMKIGGKYVARMEAKDGSFGFDFEATYDAISPEEEFTYTMPDNRTVNVKFIENGDQTEVLVTFDPEQENPIEMQRNGWQAILNNFKAYVEGTLKR